MRRVSLLLAFALVASVLASSTARAAPPRAAALRAAVVAAQLQLRLDAAGQSEMVKAIVVLKSQADLAGVHKLARKNRSGAAARVLRAMPTSPSVRCGRCSSSAGRRAWFRISSRCGSSTRSPLRPRPR